MGHNLIEEIKRILIERDMSQSSLSKLTGISKATISRLLSGKQTNNTQDTINKIVTALNIDKNELNRKTSLSTFLNNNEVRPLDLIQVKILGSVRAGVPMMVNENYEGEIKVSKEHLSPGKMHYALKIQGDSMDKEFPEGTFVVVEKTEVVENGDIAVVGINGNEATVKKVQFHEENIVLIPMSNNPKYIPVIKHYKRDDIHIFGKVVQSIKYY